MNKEPISTELLKSRLLESNNIEEFIEVNANVLTAATFRDYIYMLLDAKGIKLADAFAAAHLNESYGYQLLNGKRQPSRDKVIQLAFGACLTLAETNRLLMLAGKSELYVKDQRDAVIMFGLSKKWSIFDVETLLIDRQLDCLIKNVK